MPSGLPLVPLDESLCEQAFLNLVQNAYEAMQETREGGTLRVELQSGTRDEQKGVELRLADTGPGVPEELREEIFNPFVTTKKTGVGLGLSIVSKIVDGHHGSIHVENAPDGGAVFTLFFPLEEPGESKVAQGIPPDKIRRIRPAKSKNTNPCPLYSLSKTKPRCVACLN